MESRPPQEPPPPRRQPAGRKPNGAGSPPAPPWFWVFLILVVGAIIWLNTPRNETEVTYGFFRQQLEADNVKSLNIQGLEVRGDLREKEKYAPPSSTAAPKEIQHFVTYFPSDNQI